MCCRSVKAPFTPHCTNWSRKAGSPPSGSRPKITAGPSFIPSPASAGNNSNRRPPTGSGCRPPSRISSKYRRPNMRIEHWWFTAPLRLRSILCRNDVERELDEELQFHIENKIEEGIAHGLSPKEARYAAL